MRRKTLTILPGLRWEGKIHVLAKEGNGYLVDFDAINPKSTAERHIMDRALLSAEKLTEWTGWTE